MQKSVETSEPAFHESADSSMRTDQRMGFRRIRLSGWFPIRDAATCVTMGEIPSCGCFELYPAAGWFRQVLPCFTKDGFFFDMDIQIATLCDFAADYNGKLVVSGTFDTLAARALPVVHPACSLAMRFCFTQEDVGKHKLSINIINEDGESLDPDHMPIEPEFEVKLPNDAPFNTRNMVMNLQGLRFHQDGIYSVDIGYDGELMMRLPLRVLKVNG
jgi:hypothetical protein